MDVVVLLLRQLRDQLIIIVCGVPPPELRSHRGDGLVGSSFLTHTQHHARAPKQPKSVPRGSPRGDQAAFFTISCLSPAADISSPAVTALLTSMDVLPGSFSTLPSSIWLAKSRFDATIAAATMTTFFRDGDAASIASWLAFEQRARPSTGHVAAACASSWHCR